MSSKLLIAALFAFACAATTAQAAKLYKWVDEEGHTHYSDKVPPKAAERARSELDEHGVTVRKVDAAKSPEQLRLEAEEERLRREQEKLAQKQRQEDRVLLRTFRTEDDIIMTRDGQIQSVDTYIRVTESNIKRLKNTLADMQKEAAEQELSGQGISARFLRDIETKRQALKDSYQSIVDREEEKKRIRNAFAKDLKRFRELKKMTQTEDPLQEANESNMAALLNVYNCGEDKTCEQPWQRAVEYAKQNCTTPVKMTGDNILMTGTPVENDDISITVTRIHDRKMDQTLIFMDLQCKDTTQGIALCAKGERVKRIKENFQPTLGADSALQAGHSGVDIASPQQ
jgi:hypothetical protein